MVEKSAKIGKKAGNRLRLATLYIKDNFSFLKPIAGLEPLP